MHGLLIVMVGLRYGAVYWFEAEGGTWNGFEENNN